MKELIIFIDSGDTLVDESTEIRPDGQIVEKAGLFAGAAEALRRMKASGYRIALVADGLNQSFENVYKQHGLRDCFDAWIISETVGEEKPSRRMFQAAMEQMGLTDRDKARIVMIGNNLERDILGANRMGIHSILAGYSPRYRMTPFRAEETPEYTAHSPDEIPKLVDALELQIKAERLARQKEDA